IFVKKWARHDHFLPEKKKGRDSSTSPGRCETSRVPNGMKLSRSFFPQQAFAEDGAGLIEAIVFFRATFDGTRFKAVGAVGNQTYFNSRGAMDGVCEPT